ncbi:MAG: 5-(carboxyamino)imidazole ribonucleotide mutase [Candidatus Doudnabacteria bacterium RIFCSPLOWO2_02_FULL_49_13]|uniref:N5-carboxyaminoimidazole ribonucleotide mutase n=1 Tax=Candidatus Doudnabacteria bacterium RIFCSPHIGHO2_12_FULL_48_16 TaxID=1817838 RepID=A0A1F5PJV3_9BACT|nr:MAG: 5-(carboxyamino)imidazole ribonucleotide mutase [Candidatus Doudnabacteria bacterium RIFCSPHIGHO2_02_FULL_49_24]OGE89131.1 MAG: 5-(carboxyamino)imidazole ribonucleotide mutase [Candidatus Doudnabacteria bacterium RIFCSPHIGHO2_01_FULL_50_67]OGE90139.1 MAG: 5-(carboxyamino)imidazole ribonucleotide mutase [Candidatus Doudnabacteria bacterium RIFCSPHIGHO2_12_FULL_48_16]OGE97238.1 MAG: 5-(carboxyamino)imidazole ribonucleotide mutase [Candidatus Doudnabacteria bacterium RIFCSPLOWO2_01_FULL_49_
MKEVSVGIIMGSDTDIEVFVESAKILEEFGVPYNMTVASAHRSPDYVYQLAKGANKHNIRVFIAGAGGAAHLAGVVASLTTLPVIGVPTKAKTLDGLDSLLSTAQMPPGVPVATVGINAGKNAGLLAVQILATNDKTLENKLIAYKKKLAKDTEAKGEKLLKVGYKKYLEK